MHRPHPCAQLPTVFSQKQTVVEPLFHALVLKGLHDDVILLLRAKSLRGLLSCANLGFCYLNLTGITKFEYERKNEKDSGRISKMTPSCKWPIPC